MKKRLREEDLVPEEPVVDFVNLADPLLPWFDLVSLTRLTCVNKAIRAAIHGRYEVWPEDRNLVRTFLRRTSCDLERQKEHWADWVPFPHFSDSEAWKDPKWWPILLRSCFTPTSGAPPHPCDAYAQTDFDTIDPATGKRRHAYMVDGIERKWEDGWFSFSSGSKRLFPSFDSGYHAKRLSNLGDKNTNEAYRDKKPDQIEGMWRANADRGDSWHKTFEFRLKYHFSRPLPENLTEAPSGFYRLVAHWAALGRDVNRTEQAIADRRSQTMGEFDVELYDRTTGLADIGDFKTCKNDDLFDANRKSPRPEHQTGHHPSTLGMDTTSGSKYLWQISFYRQVQIEAFPDIFKPHFSTRGFIGNINPLTPWDYRLYELEVLDLSAFFRDYLPWDESKLRHQFYPGPALGPRLATLGSEKDPRCFEGPTKRARPRYGVNYPEAEHNSVWCGRQWLCNDPFKDPSDAARQWEFLDDDDGGNEAVPILLSKAERARRIRACKSQGQSYAKYWCDRDLPESPWAHPWSWFGDAKDAPLGRYGYYKRWFLNQPQLLAAIPQLYGKTLLCWCAESDPLCHVDMLVAYANLWGCGAWAPL